MAGSEPRSRTRLIAAGAGLLVVVAVVWAVSARAGGENESATGLPDKFSYKNLQAQAKKPEELHRTMRESFRREDLTEEQRRELFGNMRKVFEGMMDERVDEYYAAAPEEKNDVLDRHLADWQEMRERREAEREERRKEREREREEERAEGGSDREEERTGDRPGREEERAGGRPGREGDGARDSREPRRRGPRGMTREDRKERSESRNPDKVARRMAYFSALRKRAQEKGIDMFPSRGPGGPGGRGGPGGPGRPPRP